MRHDSKWNQLTPEQRETLECWLFVENLGYAKILERVKSEFGLEASLMSLSRYYQSRACERQVRGLAEAQASATLLNRSAGNEENLRKAALKLAGSAALKLSAEKPEELERLVPFARLLLQSEDIAIRRGRLNLEERCYHADVKAAVEKELPARVAKEIHLRAIRPGQADPGPPSALWRVARMNIP